MNLDVGLFICRMVTSKSLFRDLVPPEGSRIVEVDRRRSFLSNSPEKKFACTNVCLICPLDLFRLRGYIHSLYHRAMGAVSSFVQFNSAPIISCPGSCICSQRYI